MRAIRLSAVALLAGGVIAASALGASKASAGPPTATLTGLSASASVVRPTRVASFAVPYRQEAHSGFKITGTVQYWNGSAWVPAGSVAVGYYYHLLPSGSWVHAGNARTNASGVFTTTLSMRPRGWTRWQVRIPTQGSGTIYHSSNSGTHDSFISDHTCVTNVVVMHTHGSTALAALIEDFCAPGGEMSFGQVTGTAKFYYEPTGTTTWRYLGADRATSGEYGSVALDPAGTLHGHFKIVFPAQGYYLASTSSIVYLS